VRQAPIADNSKVAFGQNNNITNMQAAQQSPL